MMRWLYFHVCFFITVNLFAKDKPSVVVLLGESEYGTDQSLPHFFNQTLATDFDIHYLKIQGQERDHFEDIELLDTADLLVLSVWRLALKAEQLQRIKEYCQKGKPILALRTSTHGFCLRPGQTAPASTEQWPDFDQTILGCQYDGHYGSDLMTDVNLEENPESVKWLKGMKPFACRSWLYKVQPLNEDVTVWLSGTSGLSQRHAVAWTRKTKEGSNVFCTTLGHQEDFMVPEFQSLLHKSVYWCLNEPVPKKNIDYKYFDDAIEAKVPYTTTTLDARQKSDAIVKDNLTSRALWIRAGLNFHVAFDTDLLRYALVWQGEGVTPAGMARGSYTISKKNIKADPGEKKLPKPIGETMLALPLIAGLELETSKWLDPRQKIGDPNQLSHGPLPEQWGRWEGMYLTESTPVLSYTIEGNKIYETWSAKKIGAVEVLVRHISIPELDKTCFIHLSQFNKLVHGQSEQWLTLLTEANRSLTLQWISEHPVSFNIDQQKLDLVIEKGKNINLDIVHSFSEVKELERLRLKLETFPVLKEPKTLWPEIVKVRSNRDSEDGSDLLKEDIPLPLLNRDRRNIRPADVAFFSDGRAAIVTFDGDVWICTEVGAREFTWKRFAAGLHEPQGIAIRNDQIYVFDRSGLVRLNDRDLNGEADFYENFCNLPIQTSETREFAMALETLPAGGFVISKGGQRSQTFNPHAGAILSIAENGRSMAMIADGFREPYIGTDAETGEIFSSDQQGNWIPTTPFHAVKTGGHYGFVPPLKSSVEKPFEATTLAIPHQVCQSGSGTLKVHSEKMGALNKRVLYGGYTKPVLGVIDYDSAFPNRNVYRPLNEKFDFPLLKIAQHPKDGLVYLTGFQIWGSAAKRVGGFCRIKPSKSMKLPMKTELFQQGFWLEFNEPIDPTSVLKPKLKLESWNYLRSSKYGSGYYNLNGEVGKDSMGYSSVTLSNDQKSIFIAIPKLTPCMQMSLEFELKSVKNVELKANGYVSVNNLVPFDDREKKFPSIDFNANAQAVLVESDLEISSDFGKATVARMGCINCHSQSREQEGKFGPPWLGLYQSHRKMKDGKMVLADEAYLKESILSPLAKTVAGFEPNMPSYAGILNQVEIESIILYLKAMKE